MWAAVLPPEYVISLFGIQYHGDAPSESKKALISTFDDLITEAADHLETLEHDGPHPNEGKSRAWIGYWKSPADYSKWWKAKKTVEFWASLPDDAGAWREIITITATRSMFGSVQDVVSGLAHIGQLVPNKDKFGYWGCYRDRIQEATSTDRLSSSLSTLPEPKPTSGHIRQGRVKMTTFPENLCFVLEGQDHSPIADDERSYWFTHFQGPATKWITDVVTATPAQGMVSARTLYDPSSGLISTTHDLDKSSALNWNVKIQLLYFLDLGYMERIGKTNKGHVALRSDALQAYCPVGPMAKGNLLLRVEMGILRSKDLEAEYVGCYDQTGFMAYDYHPAFKSEANGHGKSQSWGGLLEKLWG